eukprot:TRINITY_DN15280_c0_g2_i1.p1 TRINITY_DN15280_c0_g2~~TRINITY_DN15280_c0_g2_i1.p1  ORF type:complete len:208 (-),score=35.50 TRINITY_DN15280_c0_g2_i1:631-1254(-)
MSHPRSRSRSRERHEHKEEDLESPGKPIYLGNIPTDVRIDEIIQLFSECGKVVNVDVKSGFAFVRLENNDQAKAAIERLHHKQWNNKEITVEFASGHGPVRRREEARSAALERSEPRRTLFVVNYDPETVQRDDLYRIFEVYGKMIRLDLKSGRGHYTFVEYEEVEAAARAQRETDGMDFQGKKLAVQFATSTRESRWLLATCFFLS